MQTEFTTAEGPKIALEVVTGTVIDARGQHVTSVHQGDAVPLANGVVMPGAVYSETDFRETLWLRHDTGEERPYKLKNLQVPALPGHRVSLMLGGPITSDLRHCFGIKNHNSGQKRVSLEAVSDGLKHWGLKVNDLQSVLFIAAICAMVAAATFGRDGYSGSVSFEGIVAGLMLGGIGGLLGAFMFIRPFLLSAWGSRIKMALEAKGNQMLDEVG